MDPTADLLPSRRRSQVVTAKTFDEIVFGGKADVLIEFYAPWCERKLFACAALRALCRARDAALVLPLARTRLGGAASLA